MVNSANLSTDRDLSLKRDVDFYRKNKATIGKLYMASITVMALGALALCLGLTLLAGPVGIGVVIGLAAAGSVLLVAGLISWVIFKLTKKNYDLVVFKSSMVLGDQVREKFSNIVQKDGVDWKQPSREFMDAAINRVQYSCGIAGILITNFHFLLTDKVLLDRGHVLTEMLFNASSDYYTVKNVARNNPRTHQEEVEFYESRFYEQGSWQAELRKEYNTLCAKIRVLIPNEGGNLATWFKPDLQAEEQSWFSDAQRSFSSQQAT